MHQFLCLDPLLVINSFQKDIPILDLCFRWIDNEKEWVRKVAKLLTNVSKIFNYWLCWYNDKLLTSKRAHIMITKSIFIDYYYARSERSERSAQLFRGCGFTYGKKNITSPCIHFEPLWDCGDIRSKYSGDNLIGLFGLNYR